VSDRAVGGGRAVRERGRGADRVADRRADHVRDDRLEDERLGGGVSDK
jgi:hypothetical protein